MTPKRPRRRSEYAEARQRMRVPGYLETREMGLAIWGKLPLGSLAHATDLIARLSLALASDVRAHACVPVCMRMCVCVTNDRERDRVESASAILPRN